MSGTGAKVSAGPARDASPQPRESGPQRQRPTAPRHLLQRVHRGAGNRVVQRLLAARDGRLRAPAEVTREIERRRGTGRKLDPSVRARMEPAVGADLGAVRLHTDGAARGLTDKLEARAFTSGSDVFFSPGSYRPDSSDGRRLLAHELTHVAQQAAGRVSGSPGEVRPPGDALEREAEATARRLSAPPSRPARRRRGRPGLQRQEEEPGAEAAAAPQPEPAPRGFWGNLKDLGAAALVGIEKLGATARNALARIGEVASEWAPKIVGFLTNPVGALFSLSWLQLPDQYKPPILNTILEYADAVLGRIRDVFAVVLGPLWPVVRHFMLGFVQRIREEPDPEKIRLSNRLAELLGGGSLTFLRSFIKGLGLGIWDVIRMPYDLIVLLIEGVEAIAELVSTSSGDESIQQEQGLLAGALEAAGDGIAQMLKAPETALRFIQEIWDALTSAVSQMGRGLASALMDLISLPDEKLGEESGRLVGGIAFDVVLGVITAGAGALLRRAAATAVQVVRLIKLGKNLAKVLGLITKVVTPIVTGIGRVARLFPRGAFGAWLTRFRTWLNRLLIAALGAGAAAYLYGKGEPPIPEESGDPDAPSTDAEAEQQEETAQEQLAADEHSADEEFEVRAEMSEVTFDVGAQAPVARWPLQRAVGSGPATAAKRLPSGSNFERTVGERLKDGLIKGLPKMDDVVGGRFNRSGHGMDLFGFVFKNGKVNVYLIEVKGGRRPHWGMTKYGRQMGAKWIEHAIDMALKNTRIRNRLLAAAGLAAGDTPKLLKLLRTGKPALIMWEAARFPKKHRPLVKALENLGMKIFKLKRR